MEAVSECADYITSTLAARGLTPTESDGRRGFAEGGGPDLFVVERAVDLSPVAVDAAGAAEVIHSFNSDVEVARDGELTVTETLRVRAEGSAMRHGIYRDFPLTFRDAGGGLHEVTFSLIAVSRDGRTEPVDLLGIRVSGLWYMPDRNKNH